MKHTPFSLCNKSCRLLHFPALRQVLKYWHLQRADCLYPGRPHPSPLTLVNVLIQIGKEMFLTIEWPWSLLRKKFCHPQYMLPGQRTYLQLKTSWRFVCGQTIQGRRDSKTRTCFPSSSWFSALIWVLAEGRWSPFPCPIISPHPAYFSTWDPPPTAPTGMETPWGPGQYQLCFLFCSWNRAWCKINILISVCWGDGLV